MSQDQPSSLNANFGLVADNGQVYHAQQDARGKVTPACDLLPAGVKPAADKPVWIAGHCRPHP